MTLSFMPVNTTSHQAYITDITFHSQKLPDNHNLHSSFVLFEAVIGQAVVYDYLYADIGHAQVTGNTGMGNATSKP